MRYPHRIRLVDVRNRQPSQGAAYNAINYDLLKIIDANAVIPGDDSDIKVVEAYLNANHVEPPNSAPVTFDVDSLITVSDDGDRNLNNATLNVRIPVSQIERARAFFIRQRQRSLTDFGYTTTSTNITFISFGPNDIGQITRATENALGSSVLYGDIDVDQISMGPIDKRSGILSDLVSNAVANFTIDRRGPTFSGFIPPTIAWKDEGRNFSNIPSYRYDVIVDVGAGYPWQLSLSRVDRYPDNYSFRAIVPFLKL